MYIYKSMHTLSGLPAMTAGRRPTTMLLSVLFLLFHWLAPVFLLQL